MVLSGAYPILGPSFMLNILTISIYVHAIVSSHSEAISGFEPAAVTVKFQAIFLSESERDIETGVCHRAIPPIYISSCLYHPRPSSESQQKLHKQALKVETVIV